MVLRAKFSYLLLRIYTAVDLNGQPIFIASKAFWFFARPENLPLIVFSLGFLALMRGRKRRALWFNGLGLLLYGGIALLPVGDVFLRPLETHFAANPKITDPAGIIILGGGEDETQSDFSRMANVNDAGERFWKSRCTTSLGIWTKWSKPCP